jgi:hypothetical protein
VRLVARKGQLSVRRYVLLQKIGKNSPAGEYEGRTLETSLSNGGPRCVDPPEYRFCQGLRAIALGECRRGQDVLQDVRYIDEKVSM